jgi:hemerythrin superfamily protein
MTERSTAQRRRRAPARERDVIALLMAEHGEIRNLFDEVESTSGDRRRDAFERLVRLLAAHETAEEQVVHPFVRRTVVGGAAIVDERLQEEREAKEVLSRLEAMDPEDPKFLPELLGLRASVMAHARAEERYEFTHLRRMNSDARLEAMARSVRAAQMLAPTHPHPGVESAAANYFIGPFAALADRARDALRRRRGGGMR